MKAITIKQPWASLIVHGIKDIENRTWPCPKKYIGQRVLIHVSGKSMSVTSVNSKLLFTSKQDWVLREKTLLSTSDIVGFCYNTSVIVGSVEIVDCVINHPSIWAEKGVYNWVLANPILFANPIPAKGKLSFWDYPGIKEVSIGCPECSSIEIAVEDYTTAPFPTFLHSCNKCGYVIMESEWNVIKEGGKE